MEQGKGRLVEINYSDKLIYEEVELFIEDIKRDGEAFSYVYNKHQAEAISNRLKNSGYDVSIDFNPSDKTYCVSGLLNDGSYNSYKVDYLTRKEFSKVTGYSPQHLTYLAEHNLIKPAKTVKVKNKTYYLFAPEQVYEMTRFKTLLYSKDKIKCIDKNGVETRFSTLAQIEKECQQKLGVKLNRQTVAKVLRGEREEYKGLKFSYLDKEVG